MKLNDQVRAFWEQEACGTWKSVTGDTPPYTNEWFEKVERYRYEVEPMIFSAAQFTRFHGKKLLEIGVGAGTDHLQWARAGALCQGVDLTDEAIQTTTKHLAVHGFTSHLQRADAEEGLPFESDTFDVVYSWGVIMCAEHPEKIVREIHRVLKPGGVFIGMLYARYSLVALKLWVSRALLKGRPFQSLSQVIYHHMESIGMKAYTLRELGRMFSDFREKRFQKVLTPYDGKHFPSWIRRFFPQGWGWFIVVRTVK